MQKKPILIALVLAALTASAQEKSLRIVLGNGTQEIYSLQQTPSVTFGNGTMKVATASVSADYPVAEIVSMDFVDKPAGVVEATDSEVRYIFDGNTFECPGHDITVYSLAGMAVAAATGSVAMDNLAAGVYIVKVNNQIIKIAVK